MKTVQILGLAPNIVNTPATTGERWCSNHHRSYRIKWPAYKDTWTRWFNMHTKAHILHTYPGGYEWYKAQNRPIYLQEAQPDIPSSLTFPREELQNYFSLDGKPFRYFTGSVTWFIALAIMEGFERIELCGFQLKRDQQYDFERPGFFYWVERARQMGREVILPDDLEITPPGDPTNYTGPLYGYEPHSERYLRTFY
jgi:hypothetical protein